MLLKNLWKKGMGFDSLSSPGQGIPGFSGIHGNTEGKQKKKI